MARLNLNDVKTLKIITISGQKPEFSEILDLIDTIEAQQRDIEQLNIEAAKIPDVCCFDCRYHVGCPVICPKVKRT